MALRVNKLPPPVFKYAPANMPDPEEKIKRWDDYDQLPEGMEFKKLIVNDDAILELPQEDRQRGRRHRNIFDARDRPARARQSIERRHKPLR